MENKGTLKNILNDFLSAYAQRDRNVPFRDWLGDKLREELPDLRAEAGVALANGIIGAVSVFGQRLREVEASPASGLAKEEWLAEQIMNDCSDLPPDTAGERLLQIEDNLIRANIVAVQSLGGQQPLEVPVAVADPAGWNEFTLKKKAREIARQVGMAGLGVAANAAKYKMEGDSSLKLQGWRVHCE